MISKNEIKYIKSLKVKKYRLRGKQFIVEGAKNVLELLQSGYKVDKIICTELFHNAQEIQLKGYSCAIVAEKTLNQLGTFKTNMNCLAVVEIPEINLGQIDLGKNVFVLDGVRDPGNLGTIIRTLDWFGFDQLICSKDSAELYNPKVINSSMGSFTRVKVAYLDLVDFIKGCGLPVLGAEMDGKNLRDVNFDGPSVIVMGNESNGISKDVKQHLTGSVSIPRKGGAESLNVGVATGIIAAHLRMF